MRFSSICALIIWLSATCHCQAESLHKHQQQDSHPAEHHHHHHSDHSKHNDKQGDKCEMRLVYLKQVGSSVKQHDTDSDLLTIQVSPFTPWPSGKVDYCSNLCLDLTQADIAPPNYWLQKIQKSIGGSNAPPQHADI